MVFVQRINGAINGLFAQMQPGIAEEELSDQDAEVLAFRNPAPPTPDQIYDQAIQTQQVLRAVILALNDGTLPVGGNFTNAQLKMRLKSKIFL